MGNAAMMTVGTVLRERQKEQYSDDDSGDDALNYDVGAVLW
jgi:hypothetical protein